MHLCLASLVLLVGKSVHKATTVFAMYFTNLVDMEG